MLFGVVGDPGNPVGVLVSPKRMIKLRCEAPEREGLCYAAANTTVPVPKVYRVHQRDGKLAIEMEYFRGSQDLWSGWRTLSPEQKGSVVDDVAAYVKQLRDLVPSEAQKISSTAGGPCRDIRIANVKLFGPFKDSTAFHECVRGGMSLEEASKSFSDTVIRVHERKYDVKFTHGDLGAQNILVREGRVVAIVDWECAGWYPEYWEYTKAHYNYVYVPEFYDMLVQAIDRYDEQLKAERELWRMFDHPLDDFIAGP